MRPSPGVALGGPLTQAGALVTILGQTELPGGGVSEHLAVTLADGTELGLDVHFAEED